MGILDYLFYNEDRKTQEVLDRINKEKDKKYEEESKRLRRTNNIPESWKRKPWDP